MKLLLLVCALIGATCAKSVKPPPESKSLRDLMAELKGTAESQGDADGEMIEGDMRVAEGSGEGGADRNMVKDESKRWPKDDSGIVIVPYEVKDELKTNQIDAAIADFAKFTCIKFVKRTDQANYLNIHKSQGCWSYVGMLGWGKQDLSLGEGCNLDKGTPTHEMMHALGFEHEQGRSDRDKYVEILTDNIEDKYVYAFDICNDNECRLPQYPYDYGSVMHYEKWAFSKNGQDTIKAKESGVTMGQRKGLSELDIKKLNEMYKCNGKTVTQGTDGSEEPPATEKEDAWDTCPDYINQCADPLDDYYVMENCGKTCAGVKKGDAYDRASWCPEYADYCEVPWFSEYLEYCMFTCNVL